MLVHYISMVGMESNVIMQYASRTVVVVVMVVCGLPRPLSGCRGLVTHTYLINRPTD